MFIPFRHKNESTKQRSVLATLALSTACITLPLSAEAQIMQNSPQSMSVIQQETTLNLTGEGKIEVSPDIATISLGVNVEADTASEAMKQQSTLMNNVFEALEKAKIADKDMQTGNISLSPRYDYSSSKNGPPKLTGYQATNTLGITVRKLDSLGSVLDSVVSAGGNTINSISFGLEDSSAALDAARKAAIADALAKAELYAEAAGYSVSRIITMNESGNFSPSPQPVMMARMKAAESASTPIAAGEVSFSSTMNVQFELIRK